MADNPPCVRKRALRFVVLIGVCSLFVDMTYEGARGINGSYLAKLGASGLTVGLVAGLGECIGYVLRLFTGIAADRTRRYWTFVFVGCALNVLAVPLIAWTVGWPAAAALMIAERVGKSIRTPARDVVLSEGTKVIGHGFGFGLHEALDQIGAVLGPLLVIAAMGAREDFRAGYAVLSLPAVLTMLCAFLAWLDRPPAPAPLTAPTLDATGTNSKTLPRSYWLAVGSAAAVAAGYADFPLIAYHFELTRTFEPRQIPALYAIAMGVDAVAALILGRLFDRKGPGVLVGAVLLSAGFAPCVFLGGIPGGILGMVLWGIGMGAQESILRATIASLIPARRRGTAFGIFNAAYGLSWFMGSALLGALYDRSLPAVTTLSVAFQLLALPTLFLLARRPRPSVKETQSTS